jgi:hypothetical protein
MTDLACQCLDWTLDYFRVGYSSITNYNGTVCSTPASPNSLSATPTSSSTSTSTYATATATACCSNGVFTGDLAEACSEEHPLYGDGQCYGQYQINCRGGYLKTPVITNSEETPPIFEDGTVYSPAANLSECLYFCLSFGTSFTSVNWIPPSAFNSQYLPTTCQCLSEPSDFRILALPGQRGLYVSLDFCPTGPPTPPPPCCEPYLGNLDHLCAYANAPSEDPDPNGTGNGKCLPGGYRVSILTSKHQFIHSIC